MLLSIDTEIPNNLFKNLERISQKTKKSQSFIIKKALENYIIEYQDLNIAKKRMNNNSDEILSIDEIRVNFDV